MTDSNEPLFEFDEDSHLMRVHLKLGLEDLGFSVVEEAERVSIICGRSGVSSGPRVTSGGEIGRQGPR